MKRLVLVHGRSQGGKDPLALQTEWEGAWAAGLKKSGRQRPSGVTVAFPFYGDKLDEFVRQIDGPAPAGVAMRGPGRSAPDADFQGEMLDEIRRAKGVTDEDVQAQITTTVHERGPQNWEWVQAIARALDARFGERVIDLITHDVYVYLCYPAVRKAIKAIVSPMIDEGPCIVVGHSLGSVVAYECLLETKVAIDLYVTVGSPLGVKAIKKRLPAPLRMPPQVARWYNAMDPHDIVPLYPLDADNFRLTPPIENKTNVNNFTPNRHGIEGYLSDPDVALRLFNAVS